MKKTLPLVLVLVFIFSLALQLPVLAEESNEKEPEKLRLTNGITTTSLKVTPEKTTTSSEKPLLEKISSPEYIKYFREIKKVDGSLYGIRKQDEKIEKNIETNKASSSLEKIPSPALVNMYNQIKKIGNDLFGIRKASSSPSDTSKDDNKKNELERKVVELKKSGLEKINSLEHLNLFEKVTKVGNELFGLKKKDAMILPKMTPELIACTAAAIDAKDTSINISLTNSVTEITAAIDARGICQKSALSLTSGHEESIKNCNKTFQTNTKTAYEKARNAQKAAWETYRNSLKSCSSEVNIEDGGEILK